MLVDRTLLTVLLVVIFAIGPLSHAQAVDAQAHPWWKHAVCYELYPRSFADSDNSGTGDLAGIASKHRLAEKTGGGRHFDYAFPSFAANHSR
jgi:hypothetical protein